MSDSRLKDYALTAGGTAALAAAGAASADIITASEGVSIIPNGSLTTLFTVGGASVAVSNYMYGTWSGTSGYASVFLGVLNANSATIGRAANGAAVTYSFAGNGDYYSNYMSFASGTMRSQSSSLALGTNLLGISIFIGDDAYYGWVDYSLSMFEGEYTFTINGWAYNDVSGEGIIAGQNTAAGSSTVPGLGGLAALAIGAAGVRSRRQRTVA